MIAMEKCWEEVRDALPDAEGICWDGCHKIYILMDEGEVEAMRECGYEVLNVTDDSLTTLQEWYDRSCFLKFVYAIRTVDGNPNDGSTRLIPQGAEEDE